MAKKENTPTDFVFSKQNYVLLLISLAVIVVGFALLSGGGSDNPNEFSEEIFSVRRLYVAPIIVLGGYFLVIYAIMKKPNKDI
jgi:ABC-type dipeptide/oligopeptide/nickel transport system permease component